MKNTILIVDDNPKNLQLASSVLSPYYKLLLADSGEKAIRTAGLKSPDLILLDIMMPGISGYEVCRELKENEATRQIPVIFLTAKAEEEDISNAFDAGGVDYVTKPFKTKEVLARIKTQIDLQEAKDILKKQNEELLTVIGNRDKLFSIIAHDLLSPFQGFIGLTEILCEDINTFPPGELAQLIKEIHDNANNLYKLLTNLLDWAKMQKGSMAFNPDEIILSDVVHKNINTISQIAEQKDIQILLEVDANHSVFADEAMLDSIFRNLLSNAVKFTARGGRISIISRETGNNEIEIRIEDNGIGIPPEILNKLFKMNEKVGRAGTEGERSSGLGLLLCKEFAEKNSGKIWAESTEGTGSTFYFTLPKSPG